MDQASTIVRIPIGHLVFEGVLTLPGGASGIVVFAQASGTSRHSPRNRYLADALSDAGMATLLIDLLTQAEEASDENEGKLRGNVDLLAGRLLAITDWVRSDPLTRGLRIGYLAARNGAAAALIAAAKRPDAVTAIVSRGGRPDLALSSLPKVRAATMLIVPGGDDALLDANFRSWAHLNCEKRLEVIPRAGHPMEEEDSIHAMGGLARIWFALHFVPDRVSPGLRETVHA